MTIYTYCTCSYSYANLQKTRERISKKQRNITCNRLRKKAVIQIDFLKILLYLQPSTKLKPEGLRDSLKQKIKYTGWVPVQKRPTFPQLIPSYSPILQHPCLWLCAHRLAAGRDLLPELCQALGLSLSESAGLFSITLTVFVHMASSKAANFLILLSKWRVHQAPLQPLKLDRTGGVRPHSLATLHLAGTHQKCFILGQKNSHLN